MENVKCVGAHGSLLNSSPSPSHLLRDRQGLTHSLPRSLYHSFAGLACEVQRTQVKIVCHLLREAILKLILATQAGLN